MKQTLIENQTLALAGLFQALSLVKEIARSGYLNSRDFETCIGSLFVTNPSSTIEVYGDIGKLERGLNVVNTLLAQKVNSQHSDLISYAVGINNLAGKLLKNKSMLNTISKRIAEAEMQSTHFSISHDNVIANIADTYSQTISTMSFRIQVKGEYNYLQQKRVADQIRALLLAAIRASILWKQNSGSVWRLIINRNKLLLSSENLLLESKKKNLDLAQ